MAGIRLIALVAMVLASLTVLCSLFNIFATDWFVGNSINVGIASGCSERNVTDTRVEGIIANTTVTFCQHFSVADLHGPLEKSVFGLLVLSILLGLWALFELVFSLCTRLGSMTTHVVGVQCLFLALACVLFGLRYNFKAPDGTHVGPAYWLAMANVGLACVNSQLCNWIDRSQLHEYRRLD